MVDNALLVESSGWGFSDTAVYECNSGYDLMGPEFVSCGQGGQWSQPPHCQGQLIEHRLN